MVTSSQQALAVWGVLVAPFVLLALVLWTRDALTVRFAGAYWFAPVVLTLIGVLPAPWHTIPG